VAPLPPLRLLRTDTERPVPLPVSDCESRPETDRREACEEDFDEREDCEVERPDSARAEGTPDAEPEYPECAAPKCAAPECAAPDTAPEPAPVAAGTGASPQVSQNSSPPPMSSRVPPQPGRWHLLTVSPSAFPLTLAPTTPTMTLKKKLTLRPIAPHASRTG
jgi:hypothetical protein